MLHLDITKAGLDPMAEMTDEEYEAAYDKYVEIVQSMLPAWASYDLDDCHLTVRADNDHDDEDLREIVNEAWEKFCEEA